MRGVWALILAGGIELAQAAEFPDCQLVSLTGEAQRLSQLHAGKVLYLDFWASWCSSCAHAFRFLNELTEKLSDQGLVVAAVNLDEDPKEAQAFLARFPAQFPVLLDPKADCARAFEVAGMPAAYLIDRQGRVRYRHLGFRARDVEVLEQQVNAILSESPD